MVRIHACHAWGRGFEPRRSRQLQKELLYAAFFVTAWKSRLNPRSCGLEDKNSRSNGCFYRKRRSFVCEQGKRQRPQRAYKTSDRRAVSESFYKKPVKNAANAPQIFPRCTKPLHKEKICKQEPIIYRRKSLNLLS